MAHLAGAADRGSHDDGLDAAVVPVQVDLESTARPQAPHCAPRPRVRERGKQVELSGVALQQHFGDSCGCAEVAVDLKRRVRVEQVRIGPLGAQEKFEDAIGMLAVTEPRPEVDAPGRCPTLWPDRLESPAIGEPPHDRRR